MTDSYLVVGAYVTHRKGSFSQHDRYRFDSISRYELYFHISRVPKHCTSSQDIPPLTEGWGGGGEAKEYMHKSNLKFCEWRRMASYHCDLNSFKTRLCRWFVYVYETDNTRRYYTISNPPRIANANNINNVTSLVAVRLKVGR